jgi:hypothetical protein
VLSFVYVGIYWNNHHHLLHAVRSVEGRILWANLHLLFWLSLILFAPGGWVRTILRLCRSRFMAQYSSCAALRTTFSRGAADRK